MSQKDFFRDTWVRYLGYANEVGESFRPIIPRRVVHYSYAIAFGYVLADTVDKGLGKFWNEGASRNIAYASADAFVWQTFASIILPGFAINRIVLRSNTLLKQKVPTMLPRTRAWVTVGIGLVSIPIIITPIDLFVTLAMNLTYRQVFK